jgi:hypothetical protein
MMDPNDDQSTCLQPVRYAFAMQGQTFGSLQDQVYISSAKSLK